MPTLLVVDDEPAIAHAFRRAFRDDAAKILTAGDAATGAETAARERPDAVVLDVHLPDAVGLEGFRKLRKADGRVPVILVTGHGTAELAIEAMKEGAFDYLLKPVELGELREVISRAFEASRLMRTPASVATEAIDPPAGDLLVGRCPAMQEVYKAIGRVAAQDVTVLITGESGTGKELVARALYQHSRRADRPFLAINCAAIPEALLESELFGHERGAFTGADRRRIGRFEQARGGTILLDEVGDMSPMTQAKILRLIQEQRFERLGGDEVIKTDVRLIAATNADLEALAESGGFRRDLFFRLNVFRIRLPALRERGDDLPLLVTHYVRLFAREMGRPAATVSLSAMAALKAYSWPGNVRELQSVLKRAILRAAAPEVGLADLPELGATAAAHHANGGFDWDSFVAGRIAADTGDLFAEATEVMEREVVVRVLRHTGGNQLRAAKILGITRGSLRSKVRALGIEIGRSVWSDEEQAER